MEEDLHDGTSGDHTGPLVQQQNVPGGGASNTSPAHHSAEEHSNHSSQETQFTTKELETVLVGSFIKLTKFHFLIPPEERFTEQLDSANNSGQNMAHHGIPTSRRQTQAITAADQQSPHPPEVTPPEQLDATQDTSKTIVNDWITIIDNRHLQTSPTPPDGTRISASFFSSSPNTSSSTVGGIHDTALPSTATTTTTLSVRKRRQKTIISGTPSESDPNGSDASPTLSLPYRDLIPTGITSRQVYCVIEDFQYIGMVSPVGHPKPMQVEWDTDRVYDDHRRVKNFPWAFLEEEYEVHPEERSQLNHISFFGVSQKHTTQESKDATQRGSEDDSDDLPPPSALDPVPQHVPSPAESSEQYSASTNQHMSTSINPHTENLDSPTTSLSIVIASPEKDAASPQQQKETPKPCNPPTTEQSPDLFSPSPLKNKHATPEESCFVSDTQWSINLFDKKETTQSPQIIANTQMQRPPEQSSFRINVPHGRYSAHDATQTAFASSSLSTSPQQSTASTPQQGPSTASSELLDELYSPSTVGDEVSDEEVEEEIEAHPVTHQSPSPEHIMVRETQVPPLLEHAVLSSSKKSLQTRDRHFSSLSDDRMPSPIKTQLQIFTTPPDKDSPETESDDGNVEPLVEETDEEDEVLVYETDEEDQNLPIRPTTHHKQRRKQLPQVRSAPHQKERAVGVSSEIIILAPPNLPFHTSQNITARSGKSSHSTPQPLHPPSPSFDSSSSSDEDVSYVATPHQAELLAPETPDSDEDVEMVTSRQGAKPSNNLFHSSFQTSYVRTPQHLAPKSPEWDENDVSDVETPFHAKMAAIAQRRESSSRMTKTTNKAPASTAYLASAELIAPTAQEQPVKMSAEESFQAYSDHHSTRIVPKKTLIKKRKRKKLKASRMQTSTYPLAQKQHKRRKNE
eukprot:CAMPEP_0117437660 /NCGR_PEP_ID=MMETSP0759-20121206/1646_1 /TAXON_ID=63605 /ORGANISM="Percolomonas cosmopolitus, Strain WS" /LENGTH=910 /DNA_ID=CAMNT_0005229315 /DNA_START=318 /DNA_END=3051 /DNA_ORIENTATION=-